MGASTFLLVAAAGIAALIGWYALSGRSPKKHCPQCGAMVGVDAVTCKYCGYKFPPAS